MVVVVGAGATGLGIAWDLALRKIPVTVVEMGDIGHGTSGRFHGLLHSGGRYVVTDPPAARDCMAENRILRRVMPDGLEPTGGYFVDVGEDGLDAFTDQWTAGCHAAAIPVQEVSVQVVRAKLPDLTAKARRAFWVPDGVIRGFRVLHALAQAISERGGVILTETRLEAVRLSNGTISGVLLQNARGERRTLEADVLVNASGPWAGDVSRLFDHPIPMRLSGGMMMVFAHRRVDVVVNRLARPGDGDILVPHESTVILGTTDVPQAVPEALSPRREEALYLLRQGQRLFPAMDTWRVLRAYTGVRPLYQPNAAPTDPRLVTRDFTVLDHGRDGGPRGVFSVVGGKWTTFRLMAERLGDAVAEYLGVAEPCRTRDTPLPGLSPAERGDTGEPDPILCECEGVRVSTLAPYAGMRLNALRTRTWFAMGPCQGTFCMHRVAAWRATTTPVDQVDEEVAELRRERHRGMRPVAWEDAAREWVLERTVRLQTLAEGVGAAAERTDQP